MGYPLRYYYDIYSVCEQFLGQHANRCSEICSRDSKVDEWAPVRQIKGISAVVL